MYAFICLFFFLLNVFVNASCFWLNLEPKWLQYNAFFIRIDIFFKFRVFLHGYETKKFNSELYPKEYHFFGENRFRRVAKKTFTDSERGPRIPTEEERGVGIPKLLWRCPKTPWHHEIRKLFFSWAHFLGYFLILWTPGNWLSGPTSTNFCTFGKRLGHAGWMSIRGETMKRNASRGDACYLDVSWLVNLPR